MYPDVLFRDWTIISEAAWDRKRVAFWDRTAIRDSRMVSFYIFRDNCVKGLRPIARKFGRRSRNALSAVQVRRKKQFLQSFSWSRRTCVKFRVKWNPSNVSWINQICKRNRFQQLDSHNSSTRNGWICDRKTWGRSPLLTFKHYAFSTQNKFRHVDRCLQYPDNLRNGPSVAMYSVPSI